MATPWIERQLARVAPGVALRRARSRRSFARLDSLRLGLGFNGQSYEGGSHSRRTQGWLNRRRDADASLEGAQDTLRGRSRDLCRNNAWVSAGVDCLEEFTVGLGIMGSPEGASPAADRARELWNRWAGSRECDADMLATLAGLQALVWRTVIESGSCLIRRRIRTGSLGDELAVPLQLQVLEPDHLDTNRTTGIDGNKVVLGVEFNSFGRRVAYWLYPDHPGSSHPTTTRTVSVRVPASEVLHVFRRTRPGQTDAAPWLSPAIIRTRSLDEFEDAELLRQTVASSWAGFVTREEDPDGPEGDEDFPIEEIEPGSLEYLRPGESIEFPTLPQVSGRDSYVSSQLRAIASCLRVPYEALTGDLTKVNYSSGRMGFNAFERRIAVWRRTILIEQFLDPIRLWFIEAALSRVLLGAAARELVWGWTPPGSLILEVDKEGKADYAAIRNGTKSLSEVIRSRGKDPSRHLEEVTRDFETLDALGLTLDCDPRRVAAAGSGAAPGGSADEPEEEEDEPEVPEDEDGEEQQDDEAPEAEDDEAA